MGKSLAVKYRPKSWSEVSEQDSVCKILNNQIDTNTIRNGYLFEEEPVLVKQRVQGFLQIKSTRGREHQLNLMPQVITLLKIFAS